MNTAANFDLEIIFAAEYLKEAIKATNNGYLFAPTVEQLATARRNPEAFTLTPNAFGEYTIRIAK